MVSDKVNYRGAQS